MSLRVAIRHHTRYLYDRWVGLSPQVIRLRPAPHCRTPILAYSLRITPETHFLNWQQDPYGNYLARAVFPEKVHELAIDVEVIAEMKRVNPFDFFVEEAAEKFPFAYDETLARALAPNLAVGEVGPLLAERLAKVDRRRRRTIDFLVDLNQQLQQDIAYTVRMEPGVQTPERTLERAIGSCRDTGWLLVHLLRHLGLAARFVSGYSIQLAPDEKPLEGPAGPPIDVTDLHAWAEVYVPGAGWIGLDPTSGLLAAEGHIPLAATPEPESAAPLSGASDEAEVTFEYSNQVTRIHETPRTTKPYEDHDWEGILATGAAVDEALDQGDVRLTMGGEPTFVGVEDRDAPEWNSSADGPRKRRAAIELAERLATKWGSGTLRHYGQGKWYPGEPLPRWAVNLYWRNDGEPIWRDRRLLGDPWRRGRSGPEVAGEYLRRLAVRLGVPTEIVVPAYEDPLPHLLGEAALPLDFDPATDDLDSPLGRRQLLEKLARGLGQPAGWVLPIDRDPDSPRWRTSSWAFRRGRLFLIPGDSPVGLRLPLDAVTAKPEKRLEREPEQSLMEVAPALPPVRPAVVAPSPALVLTGKPLRTAITAEVQDGRLELFLPPQHRLESYLELIAEVEASAAELGVAVVVAGYPPPEDDRVTAMSITPDPGVLEVNVPPARSWRELVDRTLSLYDEARECRLSAEKFLLDGRHTGTGGGNHVTLGARTAWESPLLRRPELLASLVTYWQHHPGLSYLFSGTFIGPTSQAPRVDEGRDEALYELEIALGEMPSGDTARPWLVDRLLRNLLIDVTGNTHRSEFCIDKLYSPDSWSGRRGLLEIRAFEMPPHPRMSLVQALLVRALVARFWKEPYRLPLVRWGTELHDRFLLPHWVERDVGEVCDELANHGFPVRPGWITPFVEFRFPRYGSVRIGDVEIELRQAIEPWNVLGEEVGSQGTARFVDSSLERVQVKVTGLTDSRYVLACNGRRVSLRPTGVHGEAVAGVRYRAWQPPSCLHPTIGVHSPLVFDLVDTWSGRSIGGCTYHVSHPGGRSYETIPVNALEAESRRINRFFDIGHTPDRLPPMPAFERIERFFPYGHPPGPMSAPLEEPNPEYPYTLDLRRRPPIR